MRLIAKSLLGAALLVSASASADLVTVPAASGHYFWEPGLIQENAFVVFDNTVCAKLPSDRFWDTPLVLHNFDGGNVLVFAKRLTNTISSDKSQAYSVDELGAIYAWTGASTNNAFLGQVSVPAHGTLFAEARMSDSIDDVAGCVYQYRAEW